MRSRPRPSAAAAGALALVLAATAAITPVASLPVSSPPVPHLQQVSPTLPTISASIAPPLELLPSIKSAPAPAHAPLGERIAHRLKATGLSDALIVVIVSALPVVELRAGVPVGIALLGLAPTKVFLLAVVGNLLPVALLLPLLQLRVVQRIAAPVLDRARAKAAAFAAGTSTLTALALFVGVPAPGTGAYTGVTIAFVLNLGVGESFAAIAAGVVMSAVIMTLLSVAGRAGAAAALVAMLAVGVGSMTSWKKSSRSGSQVLGGDGDAD